MCRGRGTIFSRKTAPIAERRLGLALAAREGLVHLLGPGHGAHAAPAAAGRGLQHHRIADRLGLRLGLVARGERCGAPGMTGMPCDWANARAATLSPNSFRLSGEGR